MYLFLIPLILGFAFNSASASTTSYSDLFGERASRLICIVLRNVLGIPVWALGYYLAARASPGYLFGSGVISSALAWLLSLSGVALICAGLWSLRWRAAAPSMKDTLVTHGIYAYIRHPVYSGLLLELSGLFIWIRNLPVLLACILGLAWIAIQARLEERDLVRRLPAYREYMLHVPRFLPKIRHD